MTDNEAAAAHDKDYLKELHAAGKTYHVYVYRWGLVQLQLPGTTAGQAQRALAPCSTLGCRLLTARCAHGLPSSPLAAPQICSPPGTSAGSAGPSALTPICARSLPAALLCALLMCS